MAELFAIVSTVSFVIGYIVGGIVCWVATNLHWRAKLSLEEKA